MSNRFLVLGLCLVFGAAGVPGAAVLAAGAPASPAARLDAAGEDSLKCFSPHIIQGGETLFRIALKCGSTVAQLAALNRIANPSLIHPGQLLQLPGAAPSTRPPAHNGLKGLALADPTHPEDIASLGARWWFVWGWCSAPDCIPMARAMQAPPECPPLLLFGNEPNAIEPYGAPVIPEEAVNRALAVKRQCPDTRLVAGNVSLDDWTYAGGWGGGVNWLMRFVAGWSWATGGQTYPDALGVHCYNQTARPCLERLADLRTRWPGALWLTEYGVLSGDAADTALLTAWAAANTERYAVYTNRQPDAVWSLPGASLVHGDGSLTPAGRAYADQP